MPAVRYSTINGEIIAEKRDGVRRNYVPDPLGSIRALLDKQQQITDRFDYWPYGETRTRTGSTTTPFRFVGSRGYYRDRAARTYVRARTLLPSLGRWSSLDPFWARLNTGMNRYLYVSASPIGGVDPSGLLPGECCDGTGKAWSCERICHLWRHKHGNTPGAYEEGGPLQGYAGVVCCGSKKCACWFGWPNYPPKGECLDLEWCFNTHERRHFDDVACDPRQGLHRPPFRPGVVQNARECPLRKETVACLKRSRSRNSARCRAAMDGLIENLEDFIRRECKSYLKSE